MIYCAKLHIIYILDKQKLTFFISSTENSRKYGGEKWKKSLILPI